MAGNSIMGKVGALQSSRGLSLLRPICLDCGLQRRCSDIFCEEDGDFFGVARVELGSGAKDLFLCSMPGPDICGQSGISKTDTTSNIRAELLITYLELCRLLAKPWQG